MDRYVEDVGEVDGWLLGFSGCWVLVVSLLWSWWIDSCGLRTLLIDQSTNFAGYRGGQGVSVWIARSAWVGLVRRLNRSDGSDRQLGHGETVRWSSDLSLDNSEE